MKINYYIIITIYFVLLSVFVFSCPAFSQTSAVVFPVPTPSNASINLPHGTAPTAPNNGDCWTTTAGLFCQINGVLTGPNSSYNALSFTPTPNYIGLPSDSLNVTVAGSPGAPVTSQGAAGVFEKYANNAAFNALAGLSYKYSSAPNARGTAIYGESVDKVGGLTSFVEGGRFQSTLASGSGGSGYGVICQAGTAASGVSSPAYLIGCEGEVDNQVGPDAPTYGSFNRDAYTASFVATNGLGGGTRYKADAAFVTNSYSKKPFRTGLYVGAGSVDNTVVAAAGGVSVTNGIDLHLASISFSLLSGPNSVPIRMANATGSALLGVLSVDSSNNLNIGSDVTGQAVIAPQAYLANGFTIPGAKAGLDANGGLKASAFVATGNAPTANTGTCTSIGAVTGGSAAGAFSTSGSCASGSTIKLVFGYVAPNGWACTLQDQVTAVTMRQVSYSTTSCTITTSAPGVGSGDVIVYQTTAF